MPETAATPGLYRLLAWASPSFPTGAFSYSHGLEATVAEGTVHDRGSLEAWIATVVAQGSGRIDADILRDGYRAAAAGDLEAFDVANRRGAAFRATAELALESAQQGNAFAVTRRAAWAVPRPDKDQPSPHLSALPLDRGGLGGGDRAGGGAAGRRAATSPPPRPSPTKGEGDDEEAPPEESSVGGVCHSAAFGAAAARAGIALDDVLAAYLQAFAGNLVSAGIRLGVIGQTDGQRILAALEPVVTEAARASFTRDPADFGSASFAVDLASMAHETQYSRLFRS